MTTERNIFDLVDELENEPAYGPGGDFGAVQLLSDLVQWRHLVDDAIGRTVTRARAEGRTWEDVGDVLGMSRQGAQQRYGAQ